MESKKRKVDLEGRTFNDGWTLSYFFIEHNGKCVCFICQEIISVKKVSNIKRHYESRHSKYNSFTGEIRDNEVARLKNNFTKQSSFFTRKVRESDSNVRASYEVSKLIAERMKPFTDGEFFKELLLKVADVVCPEKKELFSSISLSARTVTRRIEELAANVRSDLGSILNNLEYFSIAIDESTDLKDTCQLAVFVRGVTSTFDIIEEFVRLIPMKDTSTGKDIFESIIKWISEMNLDLSKLSGVITDGAPAMVGQKRGFATLLHEHIGIDKKLINLHCIIHQEALCAKSLDFKDIMAVVVKKVNFILSRGLNHRQFQEFLKEIEAEYGDLTYFSNVRWLSRGKMLRRVYALREEISMFLESKDQDNSDFENPQWIIKLAYLVDITTHMNTLNLELQGNKKSVFDLFCKVTAFERKLQLWEAQLQENNYSHFPCLQNHEADIVPDIFVNSIMDLRSEFSSRFADFRRNKNLLKLFGAPFLTEVEQVEEKYQLELIDLQCDESLKSKFNTESIADFYKKYILPSGKYDNILANAKLMTSLFGSTYACEQLFSKMNYTKSKLRTRLDDNHLDAVLLLSSTNISPDVEKLSQNKQKQVSH